MDMQNYTTPFANTGETEDFSIGTDPSGKVSLEKGWTELYELRPEEGGLFILRKVFNQMMKLVSTDTVSWKTQTFPNWIADKGNGTPYSYPKNAIVKYTNGNNYVSKVDNNTALPTNTTNWSIYDPSGFDSKFVKTTGNEIISGVKTFSSSPISTATQGTSENALTRKDYVDTKVAKVTSSDNSIVRFDGISGDIKNSRVYVADDGSITSEGLIVSYNNYIASTDYTDGNYIRMQRQGAQGLDSSLEVVVQNTKTLEILSNGSYLSKSYGAIGYGNGAGGVVTQVGSKAAEVALNKPSGTILTHNQTLNAGQSVIFPVYNAYFDSFNDIAYPIVVGSSKYRVESLILASDNKYHIKLTNVSDSSLSESVEIRFVIFKGARL